MTKSLFAERGITFGRAELLVAIAGLTSGAFAACAYYSAPLRPLAHTFGLWILLVAVVSARQRVAQAILRSALALVVAVPAFYVGKVVVYGLEYPGTSNSVNLDQIALWCVLAVLGGVLFGCAFHAIGRDDVLGALATAAAIGLLLGDAVRRASSRNSETAAVFTFAVLAIVILMLVSRGRRWVSVAAFSVPATLLGYLIASAPDYLEDVFLFR